MVAIRDIAYKLISGLNTFSSKPNSLRVLAYHTVTDKELFFDQLSYLKNNFNIIDIELLRNFFQGNSELPPKALLITFDDGDISVFENGLPVLKKLGLPSAMFVITGLLDTQKTFWCRWVEKVFEKDGKSYAAARIEVNRLKSVREEDRRAYLSGLSEINSQQLTTNQIHELQRGDMFIGNHTHTHPMINNCNSDQIVEEMNCAKQKFNKMALHKNFQVFAYPNGNWEPNAERVLVEVGIEMAFLFDHQINTSVQGLDPMRISRIRVNADDKMPEFKVKVSGLHSKLMNLKRNILK